MNKQFYHGIKEKRQFTAMVEVGEIKDFEYRVTIGTVYRFETGVSKVSKGDQYNRKIGRNIASGRSFLVEYLLTNCEYIQNNTMILHFEKICSYGGTLSPIKNIVIQVNPSWEKPHLIHATI